MTRLGRTLTASVVAALAAAAPAAAGDGTFGRGSEVPVPGEPHALAVGDFNEDGRPDLAVATRKTPGHVAVRLGETDGGYRAADDVATVGLPEDVVVADFTGDGSDDLAIANGKRITLVAGQGDGKFLGLGDIQLDNPPLSLAVTDFNSDGKEDLAFALGLGGDDDFPTVMLGDGYGRFTATADIDAHSQAVASGDFNADGHEDLLWGGKANSMQGAERGKGGGLFDLELYVPLPGPVAQRDGFAVGDFDGDGNLDFAAAIPAAKLVSIQLGRGDVRFRRGPDLPASAQPATPTAADVDSDGDDDLLVADTAGAGVRVWLGDGSGAFADGGETAVAAGPTDLAMADFDGDGNVDLASVSPTAGGVSIRYGLGSAPLTGNLLVNGGFDGPRAARAEGQSSAIPGWERRGGITYTPYGVASHAFHPARLDAARLDGGTHLLWGGDSRLSDGVTEAFQTVDITGSAASIDAGLARANLSAKLGGALALADSMKAEATFLDASGARVGSFVIGPVTAADRAGLTTLLRRAASAPVPAGTRSIRVTLTSTDADKKHSSATADNVKLTLDAPEPQPQPQPQPDDPVPAAAFGADTRVTLRAVSRRRVRVTNRNGFAVTGTLNGRQRLELAPGGGQTVSLRVSRKRRRKLVTAVVRDPAGNTRTVRRRVRLRR